MTIRAHVAVCDRDRCISIARATQVHSRTAVKLNLVGQGVRRGPASVLYLSLNFYPILFFPKPVEVNRRQARPDIAASAFRSGSKKKGFETRAKWSYFRDTILLTRRRDTCAPYCADIELNWEKLGGME